VGERAFFMVANVVVRRSGSIAVAVIIGVHLVLVGAVVWLFVEQTALSRVGGTWSVLAQAVGGEGREYIERAAIGLVEVTKGGRSNAQVRISFSVFCSYVSMLAGLDNTITD